MSSRHGGPCAAAAAGGGVGQRRVGQEKGGDYNTGAKEGGG